jgi:hypothetical protein
VLKDGLAERRIWAYIRNSRPDPFIAGESGFSRGTYEGDRALILGPNAAGTVDVHVKKRAMTIPCCFLFPEQPTAKGQTVVVTSGERVGEVFSTRKQAESGLFPLIRRGGKGTSELAVEPERLARCDPK